MYLHQVHRRVAEVESSTYSDWLTVSMRIPDPLNAKSDGTFNCHVSVTPTMNIATERYIREMLWQEHGCESLTFIDQL